MATTFENSEPVLNIAEPHAALEVENLNPTPQEDGDSLTWNNLWVTVAGGISILRGLTGYALPGELLAIMGPSGCGNATLLDTLAGRPSPNTRQDGDIPINGRKQALAYGTSPYVTQEDALIATLTVREAVYYSAQLQLPDSMMKSDKKARAEMTIREMGKTVYFGPVSAANETCLAESGWTMHRFRLEVSEGERLNGHYGVTAFVVRNTLSALPFLALVALIPGAITYFPPGLHKRYEHFFFFVTVLFVSMMLAESLMMIVASLVPNFLMGIIGARIQGLMVLVGVFFRLPTDLPKPLLKYPLYHIAFHKYAYQALFKNEYEGTTFPNVQGGKGSLIISGEEILKETWHLEMGYAKWVELAILFAMVGFYRVIAKFIYATRRERECSST
ncbi:RNA-binding family protein isoform 1 [Hibiscus syriacus]|uniref:RNA-binding family protein isoform 1 n=1 Tax=Hibiscus syriacus TaxID=106335 RepID=A0A6A3A439_HIBSY|nr:RNA-binding family protein isoform 1 [Hibiscus syriacus]